MEKKTIKIDALRRKEEARLVAGMYEGDRRAQSELYAYCSDYFWDNYRGVFFTDEEAAKKIFQTAFITLWEKIEQRKIYASEGYVMGKNNKPLNGSILTYSCCGARKRHFPIPLVALVHKVGKQGYLTRWQWRQQSRTPKLVHVFDIRHTLSFLSLS